MSGWLYRHMLALYPAELRSEYGSEMLAQFVDDWYEARKRGLAARLDFWLRIALDWIRSVGSVHAEITGHDLTAAWGNLRRRPWSTSGFILLLTAVIAINVVGITLAERIIVRPLPFESRGRLVFVAESREAGSVGWLAVPRSIAETMRQSSRTLQDVATISGGVFDNSDGVRRRMVFVTPTVFADLDVKPAAGVIFREGDEDAVVLGHRIWEARYGSSWSAIGKMMRFAGRAYRIVGALAEQPDALFDADVWASQRSTAGGVAMVVARIRPGFSLGDALQEFAALRSRAQDYWPAELSPLRRIYRDPVFDYIAWGSVVIFFLVLLLACTALVSLQLGQAIRRRRDSAIRVALGASRARIVRFAMTESLAVSLLAGLLSLPITAGAILVFHRAGDTWGSHRLAGWTSVQFDETVVALTIGLCVLAGGLAGSVPAWRIATRDPWAILNCGQFHLPRTAERLRSRLLCMQVGLAGLILFAAVTFSIEGRRRLVAPQARYFDATWSLEFPAGVRSMSGLGGMVERLEAAGHRPIVTSTTPFGQEPAAIECQAGEKRFTVHIVRVNARFFDIPGFQWIRGQAWTESDAVRRDLPPIVISESLAQQAGLNPGDVLTVLNANGQRVEERVAGVIKAPPLDMYQVWPSSLIFLPWQQGTLNGISLLADGDPSGIAGAVSKPILRSFASRIRENSIVWITVLTILWCSGLMALSLALIGAAAWLGQCFAEHGLEIAFRCSIGIPARALWMWAVRRVWRPLAVGLAAAVLMGCVIFMVPSRLLTTGKMIPAIAGLMVIAVVWAFWSLVLWIGSARAMADLPARRLRSL